MKKPKRYTIRVQLDEALRHDIMGHFSGFLDMLRYVGLLNCNTPGFPNIIEYVCSHDPERDMARWQSFGFNAEIAQIEN